MFIFGCNVGVPLSLIPSLRLLLALNNFWVLATAN